MILLFAQTVLVVLIAVPTMAILTFPLHAALLFRRQARRSPRGPESGGEGMLSVIVPVKGLDEGAGANFASMLQQQYPAKVELLFCVEEKRDPVVPLIRQLAAGQGAGRVRLLITGPAGSALGKMHNIVEGIAAARGDRLVLIDSDVRLPDDDYLARFVRALDQPKVGLVTCYPANRGARIIPAALLSLMINNDLLGYFSVIALWGGRLDLANGACMALRRDTVEELGDLTWLKQQLLMDSALARRVCAAGYEVQLHDQPAPVVQTRTTLRAWWRQIYRWQASMLRVLPAPVYALFCWARGSLALALCLVLLSTFSAPSLVVLGAVITSRLVSAALINRLYIKDPSWLRYIWLIPAVDLFNAAASIYPLVCRASVNWRGRRYRVGVGGLAVPLDRVEDGSSER